jgi:hypothetical protein
MQIKNRKQELSFDDNLDIEEIHFHCLTYTKYIIVGIQCIVLYTIIMKMKHQHWFTILCVGVKYYCAFEKGMTLFNTYASELMI